MSTYIFSLDNVVINTHIYIVRLLLILNIIIFALIKITNTLLKKSNILINKELWITY